MDWADTCTAMASAAIDFGKRHKIGTRVAWRGGDVPVLCPDDTTLEIVVSPDSHLVDVWDGPTQQPIRFQVSAAVALRMIRSAAATT